jgi:hypothetical protein
VSVTIVNGEAIDAGGAPPENARLRKGSRTAKRVPNDLIRQARLALRSPSGSGRPMSRQELAEAANAWVYEQNGRVCRLDASYIGMLERGETRWPWEHHRAGLRAVLGAATDAEIGLWIIYRPGRPTDTSGDSPGTEPSPVPGLPEPEAGRPDGGAATTVAALTLPEAVAGPTAVQVNVSAGPAVTVMCSYSAPGMVSVVAGAVRVLIDTSAIDAGVVAAPMVEGGARVYSLAERRAR